LGSPSYCGKLGGADNETVQTVALKKVKIDWSYSSREKMAMLKCASDPFQGRITNYFDLVDKIDLLRISNDEL